MLIFRYNIVLKQFKGGEMKTGKEKTEKTLMAIIHQQKTEIKKLKKQEY